jgi:hypothetical protein
MKNKIELLDKELMLSPLHYYENFDVSKYGNTLRPGSMPADGLYERWIQTYQPNVVVEVGSFLGYSAIKMAKEIKRLGMNSKVICVDTWLGGAEIYDFIKGGNETTMGHAENNGYSNLYHKFVSNVIINDVQDIICPLPFPSSIGSHILKKVFSKVDIWPELIFIDGSHEENDVMYDCFNYYSLVKQGGAMWGDDWTWEGVRNGVKNYTKENGCSDKLKVCDNMVHWYIEKS